MAYARHESPSSSVVRASDRCTEGHGFDSRWGLRFFFVPRSRHVGYSIFSYFFSELKIHHPSSFTTFLLEKKNLKFIVKELPTNLKSEQFVPDKIFCCSNLQDVAEQETSSETQGQLVGTTGFSWEKVYNKSGRAPGH